MTLEGAMGEAMAVVEGSIKAFVFEAYVEYFLAPTLKEGQIVVMDNLGAHKTYRVKKLIEERGCELWFLRPIHRISIPSKKPSRRSRLISGKRRRARGRRFWKRWVKRFRLLRSEMQRDGLLTAATNSKVNLHEYCCEKFAESQSYADNTDRTYYDHSWGRPSGPRLDGTAALRSRGVSRCRYRSR
jgi:transposase